MTVIVVGAGIAGLACARELVDAGIPAEVVERGPVVGGRLASLDSGGRAVDVGAAYITADDPAFLGRLQSWRIAGLAHPWTDTFRGQHGPATMRWSAPRGLRSLAEDLARELDVTLNYEITSLPDTAATVVLAMPGPEALRIADLQSAREQTWSPVLSVALTYPSRSWADFEGAFVPDNPILATVVDDGSRRGDRAPVLVAHSTPRFADGDPATLADEAAKFLEISEIPDIKATHWPYALPAALPGAFAQENGVYLCGDAYGRPRVQTAWQSGRATARAIIAARA